MIFVAGVSVEGNATSGFIKWLQALPGSVKTRGFYQFTEEHEGDRNRAFRLATPVANLFQIYRRLDFFCDGRGIPQMAVYAPNASRLANHSVGKVVEIGFVQATSLYVLLDESGLTDCVYEGQIDSSKSTGLSLEQWIRGTHDRLKMKFGKRAWEAVVAGPAPFDDCEMAIVRARCHFKWRVLGFTDDRLVRFEVTNASKIFLRYFTIGVRDVNGTRLTGAIPLPVSKIAPGQSAELSVDCYRDSVDPRLLTFFDFAEPIPETRLRFWELRADR